MKPFTVINVPQRSPEWFAARLGRLTGSAASEAIAQIKSGEAAGRRNLRTRLVLERLTNECQEDGYINAAMQWGIDHEAEARSAFEAVTGELVTETGFCQHSTLMAGCSLDGHLGDFDELVSIKCPTSGVHMQYLTASGIPSSYVPQMLHELAVTGAKVYHFLSFDPRFPKHLRTCYVHVERDDAAVADYWQKAIKFLDEVDRDVSALMGVKVVA